MAERPENLLDLSDWPAAPPRPARSGLPPRPPAGRSWPLPRVGLKGAAVGALAAGLLLLVVPLGGCGSAMGAWAATPAPLPSDVPPSLDNAEAADDAAAVASAQSALTAWRAGPTPAASPPAARSTTSTRRVTVSAVDAREVAADQHNVDAATSVARSTQHDLDRLLAEQGASDDPGQYDGQVAAAREELDRAVARLDEAQRALAVARSRTKTVTVSGTGSPRPAPTAHATTAPAPTDRAAMVAQLADARQVQSAHIAQRAQVVADWRASHEAEVTKASAHNARVHSCAGRSAVPSAGGSGLLVAGAGLLVWRRFAAR